MKIILQKILRILSRAIVNKYHPHIIGITGSVGKTSTKEAVYYVLKDKFNVRQSIKNYNNEIGLPLTIIGEYSAGSSLAGWLIVFLKAFKLILLKDPGYPEILILEMGVDRPGDMDYLLKIVHCDIGILTSVGVSHLEFFGSRENIQKEKGKLIINIDPAGCAVINYDDDKAREVMDWTYAKKITYGYDDKADVRAKDDKIFVDQIQPEMSGISFVLMYGGESTEITIRRTIGLSYVYSIMAATAVGLLAGIEFVQIADSLKHYIIPPGRMNVIAGVKDSIIIDDTYNSSPTALEMALKSFTSISNQAQRRIAVLGNMLELGEESERSHLEIGQSLRNYNIDILVTIGERARSFASGAFKAGYDQDSVKSFTNSDQAGQYLKNLIKSGDYILAKGSQGARVERAIKPILAKPGEAEKLLVRQGQEWNNI